jgi:endonuclease/exonuclease/phosphatase family metal-dependent hydrolase
MVAQVSVLAFVVWGTLMSLSRLRPLRAALRPTGLVVLSLAAAVAPALGQTDVVLSPAAATVRAGSWTVESDTTAAGGAALRHPDGGAAKRTTPLASPVDYFELTFEATAGVPYRLWLHGRADQDRWSNDSVFVQFAGSVTAAGSAAHRIGTTAALEVNLEDCSSCGLAGWTWQDTGWGAGVLGPLVYFERTGAQRLRVQTREDGLAVDQIVLSPSTFLTAAPAGVLQPAPGPAGTPLPGQADVVLHPAAATVRAGKWTVQSDTTAAGGAALRHPDGGAAKRTTPLASPADYFELTFEAAAGVPYRLWLHGRADQDRWSNDSVFVQFADAVTAAGAATYRIGTTSAAEVNLEDCNGCGLAGWTWQDNGWGAGVLGPLVYFERTGTQRLRIQTREDGVALDQIVLSPAAFLMVPPTGLIQPPAPLPAPLPAPPPPPPAPAPVPSVLKVLDWNTHHGVGTDGVYDIERIARFIATTGANVVSLNEVEKFTGSWGNEDQPGRYAALLTALTGHTWSYRFAQRDGGTNGQGNLLLTTFPVEASDTFVLSYSRSVARLQILVNGVRVSVFSTHLDANSSSYRAAQMKELTAWASTFAGERILAGDFNAWPGAAEMVNMTAGHYDAWVVAQAAGVATAYAGNEAGNTRNSRIDYVLYAKSSTQLALSAMRVFDVRDASGVMPSDHRPIMATFAPK